MANEITVLGELLYIISNYEKSAVDKLRWWSIKRRKRFQYSLKIMTSIITYLNLSNRNQLRDKLFSDIFSYAEKEKKVVFSHETVNIIQETLVKSNLQGYSLNDDNKNVIFQMINIINKLNYLSTLQINSENRNLTTIYLRAFHNLPRALINTKDETIFSVVPLSATEAIGYADGWLKQIDWQKLQK